MTAATYHPRTYPYQPPMVAVGSAAPEQSSGFEQLGFNVLLVFLFLAFSRIFDVKFGTLHITGIAYRVVFAMVILSRGFLISLGTPIGKALLGFTVWFGLSVPFSIWRGGSIPIFRDTWLLFSFVAFLAVPGLVSTYAQWRKVISTVAIAMFVFTIIANVFGVMENGRLFLTQGKFANPNEMAQALLMGIPLWGGLMGSAASGPKKLWAGGIMALMLFTTFRTGSRGAMIGFVGMALIYFLRAPIMDKLKFIIGGIVLFAVLVGVMPGKLVARYRTTVDDDIEDTADMDGSMRESALTSTQSRKVLLRRSIMFTFKHPLFGVGPGMFPVADDEYSKSIGLRKGQWLGTHNSYTQVSSELGIPAFICFTVAVFLSMKGPYAVYKRTVGDPRLQDMGNMALGLHYCVIIYAITIFFDYIAYSMMLPVLGGLAAALVRTADVEITRVQSTPLQVVMSPAAFHQRLGRRPVGIQPTF
ncbi:MAG: O-antigen polymerase [Candidatus Solibacter sp.]|nr:O-antigen polymerase [Candidatus Solibacter sp.]